MSPTYVLGWQRWFEGFSASEIERLNISSVWKELKKGELLFREGTQPKGVFALSTGKVKIYKESSNGKTQLIHVAGKGEMIGFRALFSDEPYQLSAMALEKCAIRYITKERFIQLIDEDSSIRFGVLRALARELNDKAVAITNLVQKTVRQRLAHSLLLLAEVYVEEPINLSREDLANFVGTATETLIRLLKELKEGGFISIETRKITVINPLGLKVIADAF